MRLVFGLVLLVGIGLAGFAVYMAKDYIGTYEAKLARERAVRDQIVPTVDVYVAKRAIKYGERISAEDVRLVRWPETAIPEGAFTKEEDMFPSGQDRLRAALRSMEKDEAIMAMKVTGPGEDAGVASRLSRGMRAFAIRVDVASGVSGLLRPGDKVDIYWSGRVNDSDFTKLIESGVRLIAIDQSADEDRTSATIARTVTVEVSPQEVASLAQAQSSGRLSLSLIGAEDETVASAVQVDQNLLLGIQVQEAEVIQEQRVCTIKTRRGADIVEVPIACGSN
jgi:pilus assembly protein CpaB